MPPTVTIPTAAIVGRARRTIPVHQRRQVASMQTHYSPEASSSTTRPPPTSNAQEPKCSAVHVMTENMRTNWSSLELKDDRDRPPAFCSSTRSRLICEPAALAIPLPSAANGQRWQGSRSQPWASQPSGGMQRSHVPGHGRRHALRLLGAVVQVAVKCRGRPAAPPLDGLSVPQGVPQGRSSSDP